MALQRSNAETRLWTDRTARSLLRRLFDVAIASADPARVLSGHLPERPKGRCVVVGAGKAAGAMAQAVEAAWPDVAMSGAVVVPYGQGLPTSRIRIMEARHPVPDAASEQAALAMLAAVAGLGRDDLVLALISGGGSSLMALPAEGLSLVDKQAANRALLASGLDIRTMNIIRRRLSRIKGGRLAAAAAPARVVTLGISDIPGDDPAAIASGPTLPDSGAGVDLNPAIAGIRHLLPPAVMAVLSREGEPPVYLDATDFRMIATPARALEAAAASARMAGLDAVVLGDAVEGEASVVGAAMAEVAQRPITRPTVYLSGGETTVTIGDAGAGRGGRNTEFLLSLAKALDGRAGVWAMAGDTDGEDGASGGAAGAVIDPSTIARGAARGLAIDASLANHDSGHYFDRIGDLVVTGPTRTNVNDFRAVLVIP